jgi:hypothetical protein
MTGIILRAIIGLFIWLMLPQIIFKSGKFNKNTKTFVNITCRIIGIVIFVFSGIAFIKLLLNYH